MTKSEKYWKNRAVQRMFSHMQSAEDSADQIARLYFKASRYLTLEMQGVFERFMTKHKLSEQEARNMINTLQDKTSLQELLRKLKEGDPDKSKQEIIKELEAPAYQARLERLTQLQNQLDWIMQNIYQQEKKISTAHYVDLANEAYYRSVFDIQQRVGYGFSFAHISSKQIDKVISSKWSGKNYSERIWSNTRDLAQDLKEELLINLVTGRTEREVSDILANKFAQGASTARRLVRTESCYLSNQMEMQSYKECGIEQYRYLATLDLRTSKVCQELDGKLFLVSEQQPGKNCPPMHPWCRSTTVAYISDEAFARMKRRAWNPKTGDYELVSASMNYQKWYETYVKDIPEAELEEKKIKNQYADKMQHKKYREALGEEIPKSFVKFQEMKYNEPEKYELLKTYTKSVDNGMISPLSGFENYSKLHEEISRNVVGIKTAEGVTVTGQSKHFMERVVGTMNDPKTGRPRSGVSVEDIAKALTKPADIRPVKVSPGGERSQKYIGGNATVTLNPDNGKLIQCNPTDGDLIRRIKGEGI